MPTIDELTNQALGGDVYMAPPNTDKPSVDANMAGGEGAGGTGNTVPPVGGTGAASRDSSAPFGGIGLEEAGTATLPEIPNYDPVTTGLSACHDKCKDEEDKRMQICNKVKLRIEEYMKQNGCEGCFTVKRRACPRPCSTRRCVRRPAPCCSSCATGGDCEGTERCRDSSGRYTAC